MSDLDPKELEEYFKKFAGEDELLTRRELRDMVKEKFGEDGKRAKNPGKIIRLFRKMDEDGDGKMSLEEFKKFVAELGDKEK